jgi:hypothetical protein
MGIRTFGSTVRLNELEGSLLAIKYLGTDVDVDTQFGRQTAARADVVEFTRTDDGLTARLLGSTLVFQRAIQNEIRGSSDWSVGVFEQVNRPTADVPDATMYQLTADDVDVDEIVASMEEANIAL